MIRYEAALCKDLSQARRREWLETDGLGGFACSTIAGLNTRRYHALLIAALHPPAGRTMLLSKLEETVTVAGRRYELGVNEYPGAVHPQGYQYLEEFRLDPLPVFRYRLGNAMLEKRLFLVHGESTIVLRYTIEGADTEGAGAATLALYPLVGFRDYHCTAHANPALDPDVEIAPGFVRIRPYPGMPSLYFDSPGEPAITGHWYRRFQYAVERERGLDFEEDLFQPFSLTLPLTSGIPASLVVSTSHRRAADAQSLEDSERTRRAALTTGATDPGDAVLRLAADQYIVRRGRGHTIIAGYPWFTDWGRDSMIALPGLTLATGRPRIARGVLAAFAAAVDQGMLPNRFPDAGETPEYNTVDATLWFFESVRAYGAATADWDWIGSEIYPRLLEIFEWHCRGTRHGIRLDEDGLLRCGEPGVQLTWMDAKIGDWVVTPRSGKPVEIQALWFNALHILAFLARRFGEESLALDALHIAARAAEAFSARFWNAGGGYLFDFIDGETRDGDLRPNQIFAISLHHPILTDPARARSVVEIVRRELLTPMGLRTLPPGHPAYRPRYEGGVWDRDSAYHQGTVWPWLLAPFAAAWLRTGGDPSLIHDIRASLEDHLLNGGASQLPEVADADPPHAPRGCFAQAWSVAAALEIRALLSCPPPASLLRRPETVPGGL